MNAQRRCQDLADECTNDLGTCRNNSMNIDCDNWVETRAADRFAPECVNLNQCRWSCAERAVPSCRDSAACDADADCMAAMGPNGINGDRCSQAVQRCAADVSAEECSLVRGFGGIGECPFQCADATNACRRADECSTIEQCNRKTEACTCQLECRDTQCVERNALCEDNDGCPQARPICDDGVCIECKAQEDCTDEEYCGAGGTCIERCESDMNCAVFQSCQEGQCTFTGCRSDRQCFASAPTRSSMSRCRMRHPCEVDSQCSSLEACVIPCAPSSVAKQDMTVELWKMVVCAMAVNTNALGRKMYPKARASSVPKALCGIHARLRNGPSAGPFTTPSKRLYDVGQPLAIDSHCRRLNLPAECTTLALILCAQWKRMGRVHMSLPLSVGVYWLSQTCQRGHPHRAKHARRPIRDHCFGQVRPTITI